MPDSGRNTTASDGADASERHPIVALGAAAGAVEALRELFARLAPDIGMGFVLIQHPDRGGASIAPEDLSSVTSMPVKTARHGERVLANHVYLVPPGETPGISAGKLSLSARGEPHCGVVDELLCALAEDQGRHAVGVVLSGIGNDCRLGLEAIERHGGLALARPPDSARCDPNQIAVRLAEHAAQLRALGRDAAQGPRELDTLRSDLDNLLRSTRIPVLFLDSGLRIRRFTPAAADVLGLADSDVGRPIAHIAAGFDASPLALDAQEVLRTLAAKEREVALEDGSASYVLRTTPYRTLDNAIDGVVVTFVDVTGLEQAEEQRARLGAIVEGASEAIISKTLDGTLVSWNHAAEQMYGYTAEEALGRSVALIVPPDRMDELAGIFDTLRRGQPVPRFETERLTRDGRRLQVSLTVSPVLDASGKVVAASAIAHDIGAHKRAEQTLRASEARYRTLVAATSLVVWSADAGGAFAPDQPSWERFTGQSPEQYLGSGWLSAVHPEDRARVREAWQLAVGQRSAYQVCHRVWSAERRAYRHVVARAAPVLDDDGEAREWIGTLADVTTEHDALDVLRERAEELRALFENSAAGIVEADTEDRILRANRRFAEMTGYGIEELRGRSLTEITHPEDRERNRQLLRNTVAEQLPEYGGARRLRKKDGGTVHVQLSASVLKDAEGRPARVFAVLQDMTERRLTEEALTRAKHEAEGASRAKDQFLAVLSHELRTPLTPVLAATAKLERTEQLSDEGACTVRMIQRNIELEARLIDDLLDLTRISRGRMDLKLHVVDASAVLAQTLDIVSVELDAKNLSLETELQPGCFVKADSARLQQVFWNLIKNSVKFTPPGGTILVRCAQAGTRVLAEVRDSGVGIDEKLLPHVFDAFEQGDRGREGLGLGLAISRALVELHQGSIVAESAGPGRGATFRVELPSTLEAPDTQPPRPDTDPEVARPSISVLLVEDHADSAQLMRELLELSGHQVEQAASLEQALTVCQDRQFDLLLSDLGLPDGSGLELVRQLRETGSVRHAIALSGYGMEEDLRRSREAGFEEHLVKPVNPRDLDVTIRRIVQSG